MSAHAKLPASAAHRWTTCPASAYMDSTGAGRGSEYAAEGTAAHFLVEECLRRGEDPEAHIFSTICVDEKGNSYWGDWHHEHSTPDDHWKFEVNQEMVDAANMFIQTTQDVVMTMPEGEGVHTYIEERVTPGHEHLGGTLDWGYVAGEEAALADLKYGRGIVVEVHQNPQQMIYALGLIRQHPEVKRVLSYIVQPRAPHADGSVRWVEYTREELEEFYEWLLLRVEAANSPGAPRIPGDHCRFCPDLANCSAVFEQAQEVAAMEFDDSSPANQISEALALAPMVEAWVKAVRTEALTRLMNAETVPGWKVVNGRGSRQWTEEEPFLIKLAKKAGLLKADCFKEPALLSPAGLEKAAAKKGKFTSKESKSHFAQAWEKVLGGPAIARFDDPREAYRSSAEEDFAVE